MSQRITWVAIAAALCVGLVAMVYSRQTTNNKLGEGTTAPSVESRTLPSNTGQVLNTKEATKLQEVAKTICTLNASQAPEIRGLRLGMSVKEVLAVFPGSAEDLEISSELSKPPSQFGEIRLIIKPEKYGSKENFVGIRNIAIGFLDGRVSDVNVGYNGPAWKHVDEFVTKFSEGKTLPPIDDWEGQVGMDTQLKRLKCSGFEINVFAAGKDGKLNSVKMRDVAAEKELDDRRNKFIKKAQQEAKP
jgi:hypothetical protein